MDIPRSGTRVAVVEQQDIFRAGLRTILDGLSLVVVVGEAASPEEARELARSTRPDVVLLDAAIESAGPTALIRELRRLSPRTAIIVLSADPSPDLVLPAVAAGAAGYLLKAVPSDQLAAAIDRATAGEAFIDPLLAGRVVQAMSEREAAVVAGRPEPLTPRETEVLTEISRGRSNKEIATDLRMAAGTVKIHIERILRKLSAANRAEATTRGLAYGLISAERADDERGVRGA